jgi:hypothetical protein
MSNSSSVLNPYSYGGYSNVSSMGDTVSITTSAPSLYIDHVYTTDNTGGFTLNPVAGPATGFYEPEKRHNLRAGGKLPHDVWALMFNNGVLHD